MQTQSARKVWGVASFLTLAMAIVLATYTQSVLFILIGLVVLLIVDAVVYGKRFYLLAHNPEEKLDEREHANQSLAYRISYIALSTLVLMAILMLTILNDVTKTLVANNITLIVDAGFWVCFYLTLKIPVAIIGWIEKN
jgi:hypothetical protein